MVAVSDLVSGLDAELVRLGYKPSTMVWYRGCWRRMERFCAFRGVQEFSLDLAMTWVDQACGGFFDKERAGTLKATDVYLFRVAAMLDDFAVHGAVLRRYSRTVGKLTAEQADVVARFQASLQAAHKADVLVHEATFTDRGPLVHITGAAACSRAALRPLSSSSAWRSPPTISPRTEAESLKRTSVRPTQSEKRPCNPVKRSGSTVVPLNERSALLTAPGAQASKMRAMSSWKPSNPWAEAE